LRTDRRFTVFRSRPAIRVDLPPGSREDARDHDARPTPDPEELQLSDEVLGALLAALDDASVGAAVFEHDTAGGGRRVVANRAWVALGGASLDRVALAGGFVEEPRVLDSRVEQDGRVTPVELRLVGTRRAGAPATVAVAQPAQPPALRRVAHDLSNPLTVLIIHLRRLRDTVPRLLAEGERPKVEQLLSEALEGGERVVEILRDLVAGPRR
jgi:signal transduction histidine kinase